MPGRVASWRTRTNPFVRGAVFYALFWGYVGVIEPYLNVYFTRRGLSGTQVGVINAILPAMTLVITPLVTGLGDRKARRAALLAACCVGLTACYYLLGVPYTFLGIFVCCAALAIFRSPVVALADALVIRMSVRHRVDYGRMRLWGSLSFASVAFLAGYLWEWVAMDWMFPVAAGGALLAAFAVLLLEEDAPVIHRARNPWRLLVHDRELLALFVATILIGAAIHISFIFSPIYMQHLGGSELLIGLVTALAAAMEIPLMFVGGGLIRRLGGMRALLLSYALFIVGFVAGLLARSPWVLLVTSVATGGGFGLFFVATVITFDRRAPDNWSASVQALVNAGAFGLAPFVASFAGGLIYDAWPAGIYAVDTLLSLAAAAVLLRLILAPLPVNEAM